MPGSDTRCASRFERDTAAVPRGGGRYDLRVNEGWTIHRGPNGGYIAALAARALSAEVNPPDAEGTESAGQLRSLSVHFLSPPAVGPMEATVSVDHAGRSVTVASAVLTQQGRARVLSRGVFATADPGVEICGPPPPPVATADDVAPFGTGVPNGFRDRYERRWAIGPKPFSGADDALAGGWIRPAPGDAGSGPASLEAAQVVAYTDSWFPAILATVSDQTRVYTVDLTVHLVAPLPADYDDWVLVQVHSGQAADGLVVEDGCLWSRQGDLLATSRQLAVVRRAR